jgi:ankyrin repeat protein
LIDETSFLKAARFWQLNIIKILLDSTNGESHLLEERSSAYGTALIAAVVICRDDIVELLLDNGADILTTNCIRRRVWKQEILPIGSQEAIK